MPSTTTEVREPAYKNLDPSKIFTDAVQRRSTYLNCKKFINSQLKNLSLVQKQAAVLEAVRVCLEYGLSAEQQQVYHIENVISFSYDRLCSVLTNLLVEAGESWVEPGSYVELVKDTFHAADEESNHSSVQREIELLETLKDLRASMARESPAPMRPLGRKPKLPPSPKPAEAPKQRRQSNRPVTPESDEEVDEDMDWDDDTVDADVGSRHGLDGTHDTEGSALLQPRILLDGRRWGELTRYSWLEVKRALGDQYASAMSHFPHDTAFVLDMLSAFFRSMQQQASLLLPLAKGVDRAIARLEYFQRRALNPKDASKASELEARILQRELPSHIRASRRAVDKPKN